MKFIGINTVLCASLFSFQVIANDIVSDSTVFSELTERPPCPPFCVSPITVAEGVDTVAELEVLEFIESSVAIDEGILLDVRSAANFQKGTIPGSLNIPYGVFEKSSSDHELVEALEGLGAQMRDKVGFIQRGIESLGFLDGDMKTDEWDFSAAKDLLIWCDGPACDQSPRVIHALIDIGYPKDKLRYYRGGIEMWRSVGLKTEVPEMGRYASY